MPRTALKLLPALLVPAALAPLFNAHGVTLDPRAAIVTVTAVVTLAVVELSRGTRWDATTLWLGALVAWMLVDAGIQPVPLARSLPLVATGLVAVLLAQITAVPRNAAWGRCAVVTVGAMSAARLLAERLAGGLRPGGHFGNPNLDATLAVLALALLPVLRAPFWVRIALGGVLFGGVVAAGSRGALVATMLLGLLWAIAKGNRAARWGAAGLVAVAILGLALRLATDRDPLRFERLRIWGVAVRTAVAEGPLGAGPGGYADAALPHNFPREGEFARYHRLPSLAESDLLELAATLGIPGLLCVGGVIWSVVARARGAATVAWGVVVVLATASLVNTQLPAPAVAWTATLAVNGVLPRPRRREVRVPLPAAVAFLLALGVPAAAALVGDLPGADRDPDALMASAQSLQRNASDRDPGLADAHLLAQRASELAPRSAAALRLLGSVRLQRALIRGEAALAQGAADTYVAARLLNPHDVWAAFGEGRARHLLGDLEGAKTAISAAVGIEPNCVPCWLQLGAVHLELGEMALARRALGRAQLARKSARPWTFVSAYEWALASTDSVALDRLRRATGASR